MLLFNPNKNLEYIHMKQKIIGITGLANAGKDTLADYIITKNHTYLKTAFAKPIKDMMINFLGFTEKQCYDQQLKQQKDNFWNMSPRDAMLLIGTKLFRENWRYDFWVKLMEKTILDHNNQNYIISDVRFENEAEMIKNNGGIIIRVIRPNNPIKVEHVSEKGFNEKLIDYNIINDGTLEQYYSKIEEQFDFIWK